MISFVIRIGLALLVLNAVLTSVDAWGGGRLGQSRYGSNAKSSKSANEEKTFTGFPGTSSGLPSQNASRQGLGVSAWGIVIIVIALILAGMGFYYFSICYSICQSDNSKYDKMGMPTA